MKYTTKARRDFLKKAGLLTLGVSSAPSSLLKLNMVNAAANVASSTNGDDYKALVCFFQLGGNDSYNMLVPNSTAAYAEYSQTRSNLALSKNSLHSLNGTYGGKTFGVHNNMPGIKNLFNELQ